MPDRVKRPPHPCYTGGMIRTLAVAVVFSISLALRASEPAKGQAATRAAPDGMVYIPPGTFWMGCDDPRAPDAQPIHPVTLDGFFIDATPVTNEQFISYMMAVPQSGGPARRCVRSDWPVRNE